MSAGSGKYDDLCTAAREASDANAVVLVIIGGKLGHGFAVQLATDSPHDPSEAIEGARGMARAMREVADQMEADARTLELAFELTAAAAAPTPKAPE
jgi:hypothetical protein